MINMVVLLREGLKQSYSLIQNAHQGDNDYNRELQPLNTPHPQHKQPWTSVLALLRLVRTA